VKSPVLFVDHLVGHGVDLFQAVCQRDLEGIVAKAAQGLYQPEKQPGWKIKNSNYSQVAGRRDFSMFAETGHSIWKTPLSLGEIRRMRHCRVSMIGEDRQEHSLETDAGSRRFD
jgi:hypothetical protein